jgi:MinD superfamily P-loop ATPase
MFKVAIASGKGGTGKTFLATNIYYTLVKNHYDAVLIDCDAEVPNAVAFFNARKTDVSNVYKMVPVINPEMCNFCGKCHEFCNYNAVFILPQAKIINVLEDLCHGCGACSYACEYGAISEKSVSLGKINKFLLDEQHKIIEAKMNVGVLSPVPLIKAALKETGDSYDIAVLDSPPGTSCPFVSTVSTADYVVLVTEPTPFGLNDLKHSIEVLKKIGKSFGVIINREGIGNNCTEQYLIENEIPLLLKIPFSREIADQYSSGKIVAEKDASLQGQLEEVLDRIVMRNGNSSNKW